MSEICESESVAVRFGGMAHRALAEAIAEAHGEEKVKAARMYANVAASRSSEHFKKSRPRSESPAGSLTPKTTGRRTGRASARDGGDDKQGWMIRAVDFFYKPWVNGGYEGSFTHDPTTVPVPTPMAPLSGKVKEPFALNPFSWFGMGATAAKATATETPTRTQLEQSTAKQTESSRVNMPPSSTPSSKPAGKTILATNESNEGGDSPTSVMANQHPKGGKEASPSFLRRASPSAMLSVAKRVASTVATSFSKRSPSFSRRQSRRPAAAAPYTGQVLSAALSAGSPSRGPEPVGV